MKNLLNIKDLVVNFYTDKGVARALDHVSFGIKHGETLGIVGESGCGKSVTALSIMRLIASPPGEIASGEIRFEGEDLLRKSDKEMRNIRGRDISMIFQEPMTALNPVYTIGRQLTRIITLHQQLSKAQARDLAIETMGKINIPIPEKRFSEYPHQLSGGMRQRVMIAMALACNPSLIIADEPTTALDVTVQALVLKEIRELQDKSSAAMMLITHDMGVISETCENVVVMYCGRVVESADVKSLFRSPKHPYTWGLLNSMPKIRKKKLNRLPTIEGIVPDLLHLPKGCKYVNRCPNARPVCRQEEPKFEKRNDNTGVACFFPNGSVN